MKLIPLTNGGFAKVDDQDFDRLNEFPWRQQYGYAVRGGRICEGRRHQEVRMHREVINAPDGIEVDHRDLDRLNNQSENLRLATSTQQQANQPVSDCVMGLKGVSIYGMQFTAQVKSHGVLRKLGVFRNPADAARAYDKAALELFGEFARTNAMMYPERLRDWDLLMGFIARANQHRRRRWTSYYAPPRIKAMLRALAA